MIPLEMRCCTGARGDWRGIGRGGDLLVLFWARVLRYELGSAVATARGYFPAGESRQMTCLDRSPLSCAGCASPCSAERARRTV